MKQRPKFSLSTLFLVMFLAGYFVAVLATWSTRAVLLGAATALIAAICSYLAPKTAVPKIWRFTPRIIFFAYLLYLGSIGPSAWLVATINRPGVRSPVTKRLFMEAYSPVADVLISGPNSFRSTGCMYIGWWLPSDATISQHEGVGVILRHQYANGGHGETYLCVRSEALD